MKKMIRTVFGMFLLITVMEITSGCAGLLARRITGNDNPNPTAKTQIEVTR